MKKCSIKGCRREVKSRGWCQSHYNSWYAHGDPLKASRGTQHGSAIKFLQELPETDECIPWPFGMYKRGGYGAMWFKGRQRCAHRVSLILVTNKDPANKEVAHSCNNRACVNPRHLRWATRSENHADKLMHGTDCRGQKHHMTKLTNEDVLSIVEQMKTKPRREIALAYGVDRNVIDDIARGQTWSWLTGRNRGGAGNRAA